MKIFRSIKLYLAVVVAATLVGCNFEPQMDAEGNGTVRLGVSFDHSTRSDATPAINTIEVSNSVGVIRSWKSLDEVPAKLVLTSGTYTVKVDAGSTKKGFNGPHYSGSSEFTITAGADLSVEVVCAIDNSLVGVVFDESVAANLNNYAVRISSDTKNSVTFNADNCSQKMYVTLANGDTDLAWSFSATAKYDDAAVKAEGVVSNLKPRTEYILNIKYNLKPLGEALISVTLDETTEDVNDRFDIYGRPELKALNFNMGEMQQERAEPYTISATAPSTIVSLAATSTIYGDTPIELLGWDGSAGVTVEMISECEYLLHLAPEYVTSLPGGMTDIVFTVTDDKGNTAGATVTFLKAGMNAIDAWDVWATRTTATATMPKVESSIMFGYKTASSDWTMVSSTYDQASSSYVAALEGLTPSTAYTLQLFVDGKAEGESVNITTEAAPQILGGDFENWHKNGKTWYPYASGGTPYWDSGNAGATTLGDSWNITLSAEDPRPGSSGKLCARMQSAFPSMMGIGKFAAGNIYVGRFAGLDGLNGTVEFGQPFTGRPTALHGWYKCNVGQINKTGDGAPVSSGPDRYQIMICLTTDLHQVNTADQSTFFDCKKDSKVVAWGEILGHTSVSNWTEFTLPLTYTKPGVRPTHIVIVATASSYGDYFTGSTDSWMCIDDFELIY